MKEPVRTLANSSIMQVWDEVLRKEVDAYLLTCRTRGKFAREDAKDALEALMREAANGDEKRKVAIQALVDAHIVAEG